MSREGRKVVMWSGGLDSTVLVHELLYDASVNDPIITFTIDSHPQLDANMLFQ